MAGCRSRRSSPSSHALAGVLTAQNACLTDTGKTHGKNQTQLTKLQELAGTCSWSPDGNKIAFAAGKAGTGEWDIYIMDADGSNVKKLTEHLAGDLWPTWSPDGERIAFMSSRDGYDIYVMDADGSNVKRLTDNPAYDGEPSWFSSSYAVEPAGKLKSIWALIKCASYL